MIGKDGYYEVRTEYNGSGKVIRQSYYDMKLELVDLQDLFTDRRYCRDGVHPQRAGAQMLADAIWSGIAWK